MSGLMMVAGRAIPAGGGAPTLCSVVGFSAASATMASDPYDLAFPHTTPPGDGRRLIVFAVALGNPSPADSGSTYAGIAGVRYKHSVYESGGGGLELAIYEMSDPPVGTADLSMRFAFAIDDVAVIAVGLSNARQFDPAPPGNTWNLIHAEGIAEAGSDVTRDLVFGSDTQNPAPPPLAVGDLVLLCAGARPDQTLTPHAGLTEIVSVTTPGGTAVLTAWRRRADDGAATDVGYGRTNDTATAWQLAVVGTPP